MKRQEELDRIVDDALYDLHMAWLERASQNYAYHQKKLGKLQEEITALLARIDEVLNR